MYKFLFGLLLLSISYTSNAQDQQPFTNNGFSVSAVLSTQLLQPSNKDFYFVTYLPQTSINVQYELIFQPGESNPPIAIEPEAGLVLSPVRYSDGDQYSGSNYQEKLNNLSFFTGGALLFKINRIGFGYNLKASFTLLESKHISSFSGSDRKWIKSNQESTLKPFRTEHGLRLQFKGEKIRWGVYQYKTIGNWLNMDNSYYGDSFRGNTFGFSLGVAL